MIHAIAQVLDAQAALPVVHGWGLADATPDGPAVHQGGGQYTPVAVDGYATWSYWRLTSGPSTTLSDIGGGCGDGIRHDLTMRLVVMLDNDCDAMQVMLDAARALPMSSKALRTTTGAAIATVDRRHIITDGIQGSERIGAVPLHRRLIAMDVQLVLLGLRDCLSGCPPVDVTCAIIAAASDAKVVSCLGDRLDGLCGSAGSCASCASCGSAADCPVDLDIYIDGLLAAQETGLDPCTVETINIIWT